MHQFKRRNDVSVWVSPRWPPCMSDGILTPLQPLPSPTLATTVHLFEHKTHLLQLKCEGPENSNMRRLTIHPWLFTDVHACVLTRVCRMGKEKEGRAPQTHVQISLSLISVMEIQTLADTWRRS